MSDLTQWQTDRPPTVEEAGDWKCMFVTIDGQSMEWFATNVRHQWANGNQLPWCLPKLPPPYQPPAPREFWVNEYKGDEFGTLYRSEKDTVHRRAGGYIRTIQLREVTETETTK